MSRLIQACPDCPGVRYEGEACRMCAALVAAREEGVAAGWRAATVEAASLCDEAGHAVTARRIRSLRPPEVVNPEQIRREEMDRR